MNTSSNSFKMIAPHAELILSGTILAIDPSTGSKSSMPGYALFVKGKLKECGIIEVDPSLSKTKRLSEINRTLREDFNIPDILACEYIPPVKYGRGGMNSISLMGLQRAIGATMAAFPDSELIEVATKFWMTHHNWKEWKKGDVDDAIAIGMAVINTAIFELERPKNKKKKVK